MDLDTSIFTAFNSVVIINKAQDTLKAPGTQLNYSKELQQFQNSIECSKIATARVLNCQKNSNSSSRRLTKELQRIPTPQVLGK